MAGFVGQISEACKIRLASLCFDEGQSAALTLSFSRALSFPLHLAKHRILLFFPVWACSSGGDSKRYRTMNPISPDRLTASERLDELAAILAAGVTRFKARQSRQHSHEDGESSVDITATPGSPVLKSTFPTRMRRMKSRPSLA